MKFAGFRGWWVLLLCISAASSFARNGVLEQIAATKTLRVCVWPDYFGISYRDPKTRQLTGIDIDRGLRALQRGRLDRLAPRHEDRTPFSELSGSFEALLNLSSMKPDRYYLCRSVNRRHLRYYR
mgnify:CR=1 FL=1